MKLNTLAVAVLTLSMAGAAFAQSATVERGGMGGGNGSGSGMGMGNGSGAGSGMGPRGEGMGGFPSVVVGTDGSAYLLRHLEADATGQFEVVSIRATGVTGWTYKLPALGMADLVLSGTNVVAIQVAGGYGQNGTATAAITSKLIGLSQASGSALWTRDIEGHVSSATAFSGGLYLTVVKPATDATGTPAPGSGTGVRSLVAVSNDGAILWTITLN
ncbi:MAG: hypothetical protein HYU52_14740 [Acidobacteria bacterium]|nr:hypothetical protein [Acidobacteriota bacterium]